jgi:superfamily II DNA or RNA helicase
MIQIAHNAVDARIYNASKEALLEVNRLLSYKVDGADHMASFQSGSWSGRSSFFNFDKAHFPAGFVDTVARGLRAKGLEVQIVAKPRPAPLGPERPEVDAFGYADRYDYQPMAVDRLIQHGMMIAQVATGGGKSRICRMAYKRINRPTLFLTTRGILMYQMRDAVVEMGEEVAVLGDGEWGIKYTRPDGSPGRRISKFCVGMVQTLSQKLAVMTVEGEMQSITKRRATALAKKVEETRAAAKKAGVKPHLIGQEVNKVVQMLQEREESPKLTRSKVVAKVEHHEKVRQGTLQFLERFELVIAEEAHEVSGSGFYTVMTACRNASYRLALTATPFMKDSEEANMQLRASCGDVGMRVSEQLLISRGILAKPYFKFLKLDEERKPKKLFRSTPWQKAYSEGIVNFEYRNKLLCVEALRGLRYGLNALMLVQYKEHGHILKALLAAAGARVEFIDGDSDQKTRQDCLNRLGSGELDVLVGSTILDVGVDVPSIGMIILAGGGKAEVALRQRIGRGLREKKRGPNVALVVDVYDEFNNHLKGHSGERQAVIKGTAGFGENVVRDFDFVALGLERKAA